jgi:hypothetical protein
MAMQSQGQRTAFSKNETLKLGDMETVSKSSIRFKVKTAVRFKPEEYIRYFEDLNRAPNAEIGPKDLFEIASI